jgi:putative ABC transport system ATP-binding protein
MGPSGSGKTTLLSILGCILSPTEGYIEVAGNSTQGQDAEGLANIRRRHVGFVFQGYNLFPTMTASENVMLALDVRAKPVVDPPTHALNALIAVGLGHRAKAYPAKLSGGEKQRVALARALAGSPSVILADEPTAALDAENGRAVMALLAEVAKDPNRAVLAVTHDHRTLPYADRIVRIEDGKIHSDERPKKSANPTYGADPHHDAHASPVAPVSPPSGANPDDDNNPTTPPTSIGGRYRIRRHA